MNLINLDSPRAENFPINNLPDELLVNFFSYLSLEKLAENAVLSKKFKQVTVKAAASQQLNVLKNLVKTFIQHLNPDLYPQEIQELKFFLDNQYLSRSVNLIDLKKDLNSSYALLAEILKTIPHSDLQIENIIPVQDLQTSQFFTRFVDYLSLLKLQLFLDKHENNFVKLDLLIELILKALDLNLPEKATFFLKKLNDIDILGGNQWFMDSAKKTKILSLVPILISKGQLSIAESIIINYFEKSSLKGELTRYESFVVQTSNDLPKKLILEEDLKNYESFVIEASHDLTKKVIDLAKLYNDLNLKINDSKLLVQDHKDHGKINIYFFEFMQNRSLDNRTLENFVPNYSSLDSDLQDELTKIFQWSQKKQDIIKSLNTIICLLSRRKLFESVSEIFNDKHSDFQVKDKLNWDLFFLIDFRNTTFSVNHLERIPNGPLNIQKREKIFITILKNFIRQGYFVKALTLATEYGIKFEEETMKEKCKEEVERYKSL